MSEFNAPISFAMLLEKCQRIVVPQIQRDYAQGRESEKEVRQAFLDALHTALNLPVGHPRLPLNLDFIYGSMEGQNGQSFLPLDGQQRLTTLFFLHWYLAWRDGQLAEFRNLVWEEKHSRFSYLVRPSSAEFFDALLQFTPAAPPEQVASVRALLEDQAWYFMYWRLDPTIQSALTMLDAIHERFRSTAGLYARLVDGQQPAVTFQLLPLEHFGLSDDLYIKMNARGKPLTAFETFKARFEELLTTLYSSERRKIDDTEFGMPQFFERRMDTQWTDFFWQYKDGASHSFDDAVMNLIWALIRISLDPASSSFSDHTGLLRTRQISPSYTAYHDRGWLTRELADKLICLLEAWSSAGGKLKSQLPNGRYFDEVAFFKKAIANPSTLEYSELAQFAGFLAYLQHHEGAVDAAELQEWMRVVFNVVQNSNIERPDEFGRSLAGLQKLAPHGRDILTYLASPTVEPSGFSALQVREELVKAKLIQAHSDWRKRIEAAEHHGYFRGQIEFLLEFSDAIAHAARIPVQTWEAGLHSEIQARFDDYFAKAQQTFGPNGLQELPGSTHLWQRALLTVGDYLIKGTSNYSFGTNSAGSWDSWKRFLRGNSPARHYFKTLWDKLDLASPLPAQLEKVIAERSRLEPWRQAIVKHPKVIDYCELREIRRKDGDQTIYLLKKQQMNGAHAELFSYALYHDLSFPDEQAKLASLQLVDYQPVTMTKNEPYLRLRFVHPPATLFFHLESADGKFRLHTQVTPLKAILGIETLLKNQLGFVLAKDTSEIPFKDILQRTISRTDVMPVLQRLAKALADLPTPAPAAK